MPGGEGILHSGDMDWDLTDYFEVFDGPAYREFKAAVAEDLNRLQQEFAALESMAKSAPDAEWQAGTLVKLLLQYEDLVARYGHLRSYVSCLCAADARQEAYLQEESALADIGAQKALLDDGVLRKIGSLSQIDFETLARQPELEAAGFALLQWREKATRRMAPELEQLNAALAVNGIGAWSRLYFTTSGTLQFSYEDPDSGQRTVPLAHLNSLLGNANRARRKAVLAGAAEALSAQQHLFASALNSISGTRLVLNQRRGISDFLSPSLTDARLSRAGLDAMMAAIEERLPFARSVLTFRSRSLGIDDPGYADLRAPLPVNGSESPDWPAAVELIRKATADSYPAFSEFFEEMIERRWLDYQPRTGKRPGGFCTGSLLTRQSRIFMNYQNTLNDVLTLAHEAGHAWHSRLLASARPLASSYPMTIAEAASTFAERLLTHGVLQDATLPTETKLILLDAEVQHMLSFLLDLPVRFHFECAVYQQRQQGTLSPGKLCELMRHQQRRIFGEALAEGGEDPWFWASKLHFYIHEVEFYNYPYTFGYLLSTAFIDRLKQSGPDFLPQYEALMRHSGSLSCEALIGEFLGEDITQPDFWLRMLDSLQDTFASYQTLLQKWHPAPDPNRI